MVQQKAATSAWGGLYRTFACVVALLGFAGQPALAQMDIVPQRVVSINVCTDQLAILLAGAGQLLSVSNLARDRSLSVLARQAEAVPVNYGQAEEIFLQKPDLVLAGTFSSRETIGMLRRLGMRVEEFRPATSFQDIFDQIERMGELLGRRAEARLMVEAMQQRLEHVAVPTRPRNVALYFANSYTSGQGTLIDDALHRAGLHNMAATVGITGTSALPLEQLVMAKPDMLVLSAREQAPALAFENFQHPALRQLLASAKGLVLDDRLTVCGGPFSVDAVEQLAEAAQ